MDFLPKLTCKLFFFSPDLSECHFFLTSVHCRIMKLTHLRILGLKDLCFLDTASNPFQTYFQQHSNCSKGSLEPCLQKRLLSGLLFQSAFCMLVPGVAF